MDITVYTFYLPYFPWLNQVSNRLWETHWFCSVSHPIEKNNKSQITSYSSMDISSYGSVAHVSSWGEVVHNFNGTAVSVSRKRTCAPVDSHGASRHVTCLNTIGFLTCGTLESTLYTGSKTCM